MRHATQGAAIAHIMALRRADTDTKSGRLLPYRCAFCNGFHVGHRG